MSPAKKPPVPADDDVVYLDDDGRDEIARALEDAERAVSAVEERHRVKAAAEPPEHGPEPEETGVELVLDEDAVSGAGAENESLREQVEHLELRLSQTMERAIRAEEDSGKVREALVRTSADFENLKRRAEREKTDYFRFALSDVFRELLPVLDNFERAMAHLETGGTSDFRVGIEMIARQLADTLKRFGLTEVEALGLPFDPNHHEAVVREETAGAEPGTILEVLQRGYELNEKLLRPALVKVAAAPVKPPEDEDVFGA